MSKRTEDEALDLLVGLLLEAVAERATSRPSAAPASMDETEEP